MFQNLKSRNPRKYVFKNIEGEIFGLIIIGLGGYLVARSVEKIFNSLNLGEVLKAFIEKKIS